MRVKMRNYDQSTNPKVLTFRISSFSLTHLARQSNCTAQLSLKEDSTIAIVTAALRIMLRQKLNEACTKSV